MPLTAYPTTLPGVAPGSLRPRSRRASSSLAGKQYTRARQRDFAGAQSTWSVVYAPEEMAIWRAWYRDDLIDGRLWFSMPLPGSQGIVDRVVQYRTGTVQQTALGAGHFRVSFELNHRGAARPPRFTPFEPCDLFGPDDHGFCFDFRQSHLLFDKDGNIATVGEAVRTATPHGGTFGNFTTFQVEPARPLAGDGYLQCTGLSGGTHENTLERAGLFNAIAGGGWTVCAVAQRPTSYSGDGFASIVGNQDAGFSSQWLFRLQFVAGGLEIISFNAAQEFTYVSGSSLVPPGEIETITARADGADMDLFSEGAGIASGLARLNSGSSSKFEIGTSRAGTNDAQYGEYSGNLHALLFIDRPLSDAEVAQYTAWAMEF